MGNSRAPQLIKRTREIWERNAAFWDETLGEGNGFLEQLVLPVVEGLLRPDRGERILEIACGNGAFARRLAAKDIDVVAFDFAETFIHRAKARAREDGQTIDYRVIDATDEDQLLSLGEERFDAAVCNMALMDMVDIEPLMWTLPRLLKPGGRFVFTIMHPCFNHAESRFAAEEELSEAAVVTRYSLRVRNYLNVAPSRGTSADGQPEAHFTFHRPLSDILNTTFNAGFVMDGVAEPAFPRNDDSELALSWANLPDVPPVFAARFRRGNASR